MGEAACGGVVSIKNKRIGQDEKDAQDETVASCAFISSCLKLWLHKHGMPDSRQNLCIRAPALPSVLTMILSTDGKAGARMRIRNSSEIDSQRDRKDRE